MIYHGFQYPDFPSPSHPSLNISPKIQPKSSKRVLTSPSHQKVNPGAPLGGSITEYFPGTFNGTHFTAVDAAARIADFGKDNYAGQFFHGIPESEDPVFIGMCYISFIYVLPSSHLILSLRPSLQTPHHTTTPLLTTPKHLSSTTKEQEEKSKTNQPPSMVLQLAIRPNRPHRPPRKLALNHVPPPTHAPNPQRHPHRMVLRQHPLRPHPPPPHPKRTPPINPLPRKQHPHNILQHHPLRRIILQHQHHLPPFPLQNLPIQHPKHLVLLLPNPRVRHHRFLPWGRQSLLHLPIQHPRILSNKPFLHR